jgi:hypothetical protein
MGRPDIRKAEAMNGFTDLRLQVANDRIRRFQAEAASARLAHRASSQPPADATRRSIGAAFGRSLRALGLAH